MPYPDTFYPDTAFPDQLVPSGSKFWAEETSRGRGLGVIKIMIAAGQFVTGTPVTVAGSTADGSFTWPVRGGSYLADSGQVVLVDAAAPINVPIVYTASWPAGDTWNAGSMSTYPVDRDFPGHETIVSLEGSLVVDALRLTSGGDQRQGERRYHASAVPGRRRPPLRVGPVAGDGGGSMTLETSGVDTAAMRDLLTANVPVYVFHNHGQGRCRTAECDIPLVELVYFTGDGNDRGPAVARAYRRWSLPYLLVDDPDPEYRVPLNTWDTFDAAGLTWNELDALGLTWDEFDRRVWAETGA